MLVNYVHCVFKWFEQILCQLLTFENFLKRFIRKLYNENIKGRLGLKLS